MVDIEEDTNDQRQGLSRALLRFWASSCMQRFGCGFVFCALHKSDCSRSKWMKPIYNVFGPFSLTYIFYWTRMDLGPKVQKDCLLCFILSTGQKISHPAPPATNVDLVAVCSLPAH